MDHLPASHDTALVVLSMVIATLASFCALDVAARIWASAGRRRAAWIAGAAVAMGGGIWSMHFIAMLAFSVPVEVSYDLWLTLLSLALAIAFTAIGFTIVAARDRLANILWAGAIMGSGVAAMHYTGMAAMVMPAHIVYVDWLLVASVAIAIAAATAALFIATRVNGIAWRMIASVIMGGAVSGMHYTGMLASHFVEAPSLAHAGAVQFDRHTLALLIAVGTVVILGLEAASAAVDRRFAAFREREKSILRMMAQRFQNLLESSNDIILVVDRSGRIELTATSSTTALGLAPERISGSNVLDLLSGRGRETIMQILDAEESHREWAYADDIVVHVPGGQRIICDVTARNLCAEPSVRGIVLTFHDVTDRARVTRELERAKRLSDEANRSKSAFIANMSHELRTPLNAILGFSELISSECHGPVGVPQYRDYARDIHDSGEQLLAIVTDILDLSRVEAGQLRITPQPCHLCEIVADAAKCMRPLAEQRNLTLTTDCEDGLPMVECDPVRIRQVILNLASNAIKFTPKGGRVSLSCGQTDPQWVELRVRDTGIGIPEADLGNLTTAFYQRDTSLARSAEGCGLGLTIAKSLVDLHGGELRFESAVGEGTRVTVLLPSRQVPAQSGENDAVISIPHRTAAE